MIKLQQIANILTSIDNTSGLRTACKISLKNDILEKIGFNFDNYSMLLKLRNKNLYVDIDNNYLFQILGYIAKNADDTIFLSDSNETLCEYIINDILKLEIFDINGFINSIN